MLASPDPNSTGEPFLGSALTGGRAHAGLSPAAGAEQGGAAVRLASRDSAEEQGPSSLALWAQPSWGGITGGCCPQVPLQGGRPLVRHKV